MIWYRLSTKGSKTNVEMTSTATTQWMLMALESIDRSYRCKKLPFGSRQNSVRYVMQRTREIVVAKASMQQVVRKNA
jgi:hypothetical protein